MVRRRSWFDPDWELCNINNNITLFLINLLEIAFLFTDGLADGFAGILKFNIA